MTTFTAGGDDPLGAAQPGPQPFMAEVSPYGSLQALVADDGRTVYLFLAGPEETNFGMRAVWVRNLAQAPAAFDEKDKAPPLVPAGASRSPAAMPKLDRSRCRFVWLPAGDGVALLDGDEILAAVVPWSGVEGFAGFSREAAADTHVASPFPADGTIEARFRAAATWWAKWASPDNPWPQLQQQIVSSYERDLGRPAGFAPIDDGQWPPRALVRIPRIAGEALVTMGVCLRPQPLVELVVEDPTRIRRVEVGVALPPGAGDDEVSKYGSILVGLTDMPWTRFLPLAEGVALMTGEIPGTQYSAITLLPAASFGPKVTLPDWEGDPVSLLWLVPLRTDEMEAMKASGKAPDVAYPRTSLILPR